MNELKNGRELRTVRLSQEKRCWRDKIRVRPPELGDPRLVAGLYEGNGEGQGRGDKGTRNGGERGVCGEGLSQEINSISKRVTAVTRNPVE